MPVMDGLKLREEIFKDKDLRQKCIPFIFISLMILKKTLKWAFEYAVQGYFEKENDFNEAVELLSLIIKYWKKSKLPNSKFPLLMETKK